MSSRAVPFTAIAGGTIKPSRFLTLSTAADRTLIQAVAGARVIGISGVGTRRYELESDVSATSGILANTGEQFDFFMDGEPCSLVLGANVLAGAPLKSDVNGAGVTGLAPSENIGAIALEAGSTADIIYVLPFVRWIV